MKEDKNRKNTKDKKVRRRKKNKTMKKVLLLILLVLVIVVSYFVYKTQKNGGGLTGFLATAVGHDENTKKNLGEIKVLILGVSTDLDSQLTDTIMVASYNPNTQKANLLSIPRDTFTGKNQSKAIASQKINAIYNITRDPEKTLEAANEITGLDIKHYALIRTEALVKLVDAIGGVKFNVPRDMKYKDPTQDLVIDLQAGEQILDGNKAEQLLRWRHSNYINGEMETYPVEYGNDDFGRMRTQRDFIVATLKQTLKPSNIFKIGQILEIAKENVETNIDFDAVKDYIPYAVEIDTDNITTAVLPGTTPDLSKTNNVSVFVVNKKEAQDLLQSMFYETDKVEDVSEETTENTVNEIDQTTIAEDINIELINGSGNKEKLNQAKEKLTNAGYNVKKTGSTATITKTMITNKKNLSNEELKQIKTVLGVGSISTNKNTNSTVDVTIIIGKDFE